MGRAIFISYRRDDTEGEAGRLFDDLVRAFGDNSVFMDVSGINPGVDFRKAIDDNVASCGVLLAMIGPTWATISNSDGARRLDDPNDFVRLEIASALGRNIAVIPVLVHDAKMPHPEQLPDNLKDLAYRNSVEVTHTRWNSDVQLLIGALQQYVSASERKSDAPVHATVAVQLPPANPTEQGPAKGKSKKGLWLGLAAAVVVVLIAIVVLASGGSKNDTQTTPAPQADQDNTASQKPADTGQAGKSAAAQPDETASTSTDDTESPLAGTWVNPSPMANNGLEKLVIHQVNGQFTIHGWGNCEPEECNWGERTPVADGEKLVASWGSPEQGRVAKVTVGPDGSRLSVVIENTFPNHAPVTRQFDFERQQP